MAPRDEPDCHRDPFGLQCPHEILDDVLGTDARALVWDRVLLERHDACRRCRGWRPVLQHCVRLRIGRDLRLRHARVRDARRLHVRHAGLRDHAAPSLRVQRPDIHSALCGSAVTVGQRDVVRPPRCELRRNDAGRARCRRFDDRCPGHERQRRRRMRRGCLVSGWTHVLRRGLQEPSERSAELRRLWQRVLWFDVDVPRGHVRRAGLRSNVCVGIGLLRSARTRAGEPTDVHRGRHVSCGMSALPMNWRRDSYSRTGSDRARERGVDALLNNSWDCSCLRNRSDSGPSRHT